MRELAGGRYVLSDRIAAGGMGEVWRARDTALERDVAVKLLRSDIADDEAFRARFSTEARHAAALHEPSIATVFDYGDDIDESGRHTTYLVMELVAGVPLSELVTAPMAPAGAAHLISQIGDGLSVAHEAGIVHRDVKPANFIVTPDGRVKITDFGIARARGAASVTDTGSIMGTPHYVAPEIAEGREATPASDIYSLGVVLYECLAGRRPFTGDTPIAVVMAHLRDTPPALPSSVPPALASLVTAAMDKDPSRRPPSAAAFAAGARAAVDTTGAEAATVADTPDPPTGSRSQPSSPPATTSQPPEQTSTPAQTSTSAPTTPAPTSPAPTTSAVQTPPGVLVDPADYIGQDSKDAKKALEDLDLSVNEDDVAGGDEDTVADVSPTGALPPESEVTLFVFSGEQDDEGNGRGNDEGLGNDERGEGQEKGKG